MSFNTSDNSRSLSRMIYTLLFFMIFAEVMLSPYYPQFFEKAFGRESLGFTAAYIFGCRAAAITALPFWGQLAKKHDITNIVVRCLTVSPLLFTAMAFAPDASIFFALSIILVFLKTSLLLLYPKAVQLSRHQPGRHALSYQLVFHGALLLSTAAGALVMMTSWPAAIFLMLAVVDVFLLILAVKLRNTSRSVLLAKAETGPKPAAPSMMLLISIFGLAALAFHLGNQMVKPYFTTFVQQMYSMDLATAGILFMLPSAVALLTLPVLFKGWNEKRTYILALAAIALLTISLLLQALPLTFAAFILVRVLYGLALTIGHAGLDASFFQMMGAGAGSGSYSFFALFQNSALLTAPFAAEMVIQGYGLSAPFAAAAVLLACALILLLGAGMLARQRQSVSRAKAAQLQDESL